METRTPFWRLLAAVPFLILFFPGPAARQEARVSSVPSEATQFDYSNSHRFPNVVSPYTVSFVPDPRLDNSRRVQNLIVDGKLMLTLEDAIGLALESNLDIPVARCNLPIAQTDLRRDTWCDRPRRFEGSPPACCEGAGFVIAPLGARWE